MKKFVLSVIILFCVCLSFSWVYAEDEFKIDTESYILIDAKTGQVLYQKNSDVRHYPASITKIMTAIIALEKGGLDQTYTASSFAINSVGPGGMHIGIMEGEEILLEDLLNAMLIRSANDTAYIIAENTFGSYDEFIEAMNKKALEIGAINTNFVNPCGMDVTESEATHLSTASDLAKIARYAMNIPKFREIVGKSFYEMPPTNKHPRKVLLQSTNKLFNLQYKSNYFSKFNGIKTGYTDKAGNSLVSSAVNDDGMELISVVLGAAGSEKVFESSKQLLEEGFKNYSMSKVIDKDKVIKNVPVANSKEENTTLNLVASEQFACALPNSVGEWRITQKEYINSNVQAPVKNGETMGYVEFWRDQTLLGKVNVVSDGTIEAKEPLFTFNNLLRFLFTCLIVLILFSTLRGILRTLSRARKRRRYNY